MTKGPAQTDSCCVSHTSITLRWLLLPLRASCSPPFLSPVCKRTSETCAVQLQTCLRSPTPSLSVSLCLSCKHLLSTRSNGPINQQPFWLQETETAQQWFLPKVSVRREREKCRSKKKRWGLERGEERGAGLTWTDGWRMECDWASCTYTHTAWLSNGWRLQLIKYGFECVKRNLDTCMCLYLPQQG